MTAEQTELYPSERVLWTGAPTRIPVFEKADLKVLPFLVLWFGMATFALVSALRGGHGGFVVIPALFVVYGLYVLGSRPIVRRLALRSSQYTITDRRFIVVMRVFGKRREFTEYLRKLPPPIVLKHGDGTGTVTFGGPNLLVELMSTQTNQFGYPLALRAIPDARTVRDIIATAQESATD